MYASWWHEKNKSISHRDAERLYGIGREMARKIYRMLCEEFELELEPIKTVNGRDAGFIMQHVSSTRHMDEASALHETESVTQEAEVCHAQSTPVSSTRHLLEAIQEPKQDFVSKEQTEIPESLRPLVRQFNEGKKEAARKENERQIFLIYKEYGINAAGDQLRQGIASEWKSISLSAYERYNPDATKAESHSELAERRYQSMYQHAWHEGRSSDVWDDCREEYDKVCDEVEAAKRAASE